MNRSPLQPFPDKLAAALGHLLVRFQLLETTLQHAVGRFVNPGREDVPPALTMHLLSELSFASLTKIFASIPSALATDQPAFPSLATENREVLDLRAVFANAAKLCSAAEARRNQLVHSTWLPLSPFAEDGAIPRIKLRAPRKSASGVAVAHESSETVKVATAAVDSAMTATFSASAQLHYFLFPRGAA